MDFRVEKLGPCRKKIAVSIPPDRIGEEFDKKYDEINESVALPGFRPGHAPRKLLERRFGGKMGDQVKDDLVKEALEQLVEEKKVAPLAAPEIDLSELEVEPGQAIEFEFELITKPEFKTPEYKGLEVKVPPIHVEDADIDEATDRLRRRDAVLETVEAGRVEEGDLLVVDWRALDGDSVEARDENAYYPYGRGVLAGFVAEGIDEQLVGAEVGAEAQTQVQVAADDSREELRGRELELQVTLKEVKRYILPAIDEAFLKKHDYDDETELRKEMKKQIARALERQRDTLAEHGLVNQLLEGIEISVPEDFVSKELENWAGRKRMSLQVEEVEEEEISKQIDAAREDAKAAIERDMQRHFLLDRIADEEEIQVSEGELAQAIGDIAETYGHPFEQVAASFRDGDRLGELATEIRHRKARHAIRQAATLVETAESAAAVNEAAVNEAAVNEAAGNEAAGNEAAGNEAAGNEAAGNEAAGHEAPADGEAAQ